MCKVTVTRGSSHEETGFETIVKEMAFNSSVWIVVNVTFWVSEVFCKLCCELCRALISLLQYIWQDKAFIPIRGFGYTMKIVTWFTGSLCIWHVCC